MDATEPDIGRAQISGTRELTLELLDELSGCADSAQAVHIALQRAADAVDSDLCVYVDGDLTESRASEAAMVVPVHGRLRGHLVLARGGRAFEDAERERIEAIAQALSL